MKRLARWILGLLSVVGVLAWIIALFVLVIGFAAVPEARGRFDSAWKMVVDILGLGGLGAYLGGRVKSRIEEMGSLSRGVVAYLTGEPLVLAGLWILLLAQPLLFGYLFPVHFARVGVYDSQSRDRIPPSTVDSLRFTLEGVSYELDRSEDVELAFRTRRMLTWGDSAAVTVGAVGYDRKTVAVPWEGFAVLRLRAGIPCSVYLDPEGPVRVTVEAIPQDAAIRVRGAVDTSAVGALSFEVARGRRLDVRVTHPEYLARDSILHAEEDLSLRFQLRRRSVAVIIWGRNEGGMSFEDMRLFVDGEERGERTGEVLRLTPGTYHVEVRSESGSLRGEASCHRSI
jgi:hypothetical protein